jgi:hypothetical protein
MEKKTAVEWLGEQLGLSDIAEVEQAKEMEKHQIIDAYDEAKVEGMCLAGNPEYKHLQGVEYYNETFAK